MSEEVFYHFGLFDRFFGDFNGVMDIQEESFDFDLVNQALEMEI